MYPPVGKETNGLARGSFSVFPPVIFRKCMVERVSDRAAKVLVVESTSQGLLIGESGTMPNLYLTGSLGGAL